ncbi:ScyD/ScyE family protein [Catellatospora sp. IY07-71]|uniref:ScyD/ScyE family protein n=1 Tax=Catellatospora sp. IY07-71 TaxID=2728827 RepID=UPI001BB37D72|nr:ScyD/ScyE family protein [Catellatospora sp. IY07-71]
MILSALAHGTPGAAAPDVTVLYTGLSNPRGLAFDDDGVLYVTEAGRGADGAPDPVCLPRPQGIGCLGATGALARLDRDGSLTRVLTGLPSLAGPDGTEAIGPNDIAFHRHGRSTLLTVGLSEAPANRDTLPEVGQEMGRLLRVRPDVATGRPYTARLQSERFADIAGWEAAHNPDGGELDSNAQSVAYGPGGTAVVDAGANSLLFVTHGGQVSTLAVFGERQMPAPPSMNLPAGTMLPMQSVPMSVAYRDGAYYVAELTGRPFTQGSARIFKVVPGQQPTVYAEGLTTVVDIAFAPNGDLYALEFTHTSMFGPSRGVGALMRIKRGGGAPEMILENVDHPGGIAIRGRNAFITTGSVHPTNGAVIKLRLPA